MLYILSKPHPLILPTYLLSSLLCTSLILLYTFSNTNYNVSILSHLCSYHLYISIYTHIFTISLISYPILNTSLHSLLSPYPVLYLHISPHPLSILYLSISIPIHPSYPLIYSTITLIHSILSYKEDIVKLLRIELRIED